MDFMAAQNAKNYTDSKCLKIDLADYGVDALALFAAGGGERSLTNTAELWEKTKNFDGLMMLVAKNESLYVEMPAVKCGDLGGINGMSARATLYYAAADKLYDLTIVVKQYSVTMKVVPVV